MLPEALKSSIQEQLGLGIRKAIPVHGGDINRAARIELESGKSVFVKWNASAPDQMFATEAKGLQLLGSTDTELVIPSVILQSDSFLVLEWVSEDEAKNDTSFEFGRQLARLHRNSSDSFGLDHDNFIGRLRQRNNRHSNWPDFFAIERIEPQVKMGIESGKLTRSVLKNAEHMYRRLGSVFPNEQPALLHGDLWSGNYMFTQAGKTSIYDPAVYFGHREMDLAMTRLFGGFSANFYEGYQAEYPLEEGFELRKDLYNLYPILVHANLFGGSYCRQAENIINRYA